MQQGREDIFFLVALWGMQLEGAYHTVERRQTDPPPAEPDKKLRTAPCQ